MLAALKTHSIWYRYSLYLVVSTGISAFAYFSNRLYFQTNDDFIQMLITSGIMYGSPSNQLLFVAKPLSTIIAQFYVLSQSYSWYTIIMLSTQTVSLFGYFTLLENTRSLGNSKLKTITILILLAPVLIFIIMFFALQWTQVAMMSVTVGTLMVLFGRNFFLTLYGTGLIILGIFWRPQAGLLAVFIVLGFYFLSHLLDRNLKNLWSKWQKIVLISVSVIFSYSIFLTGHHEKSPFISAEKREAISYYKSVGKVLDYAPTKFTKENLHNNARKVGWSKNDFSLFNRFYFRNSDIYTEDRNLRLADLTAPNSTVKFYMDVATNLNSILLENHKRTIGFIFLFISIIFLTYKKSQFYQIFFFLASIYGVYILILSLGRIPERVLWPASFAILISIGIILVQQHVDKVPVNKKLEPLSLEKSIVLIVGLFYVLIFGNLYNQYLQVEQNLWWKKAKESEILGFERVLSYDPDKPIVAFSSFYDPLAKTHSPAKPPSQTDSIWKSMILIGWTGRTPELNKEIIRLGLSQDIFTSIAEGDAYLATSDHLTEIYLLNVYFQQHRNIKVKWEIGPFVYNDTGLGIWKVKSYDLIPLGE